jgi:ABC-type nitrate/sulfonate/bicarbonate transport system permease component
MNRFICYIIIPVVLILIWCIFTYGKVVSPLFLPTPGEVYNHLIVLFTKKRLLTDIVYTLYRVIVGFLIAVIIGVPVGLLMGYSTKVYKSLEFVIEFFRSIPATALFPLFLLLFGIGDSSKIALTAWGAGLIIIVNSMYGVHLGRELRIKAARTMKIGGFMLLRKVIFPEALPQIFSGFRVALSISLVIVVVAEMFIGTTLGLGNRIIDAQLVYRIPDMYAVILITGIIGFILNKLIIVLERNVVHWKGK